MVETSNSAKATIVQIAETSKYAKST